MWMPSKPTRNYVAARAKVPPHISVIDAARDRDDDWEPVLTDEFRSTDAPSGSAEKVEVLRQRVELGQPLWHVDDRVDYSGLGVARTLFADGRHYHGQDED
jgi:hypothetical protein